MCSSPSAPTLAITARGWTGKPRSLCTAAATTGISSSTATGWSCPRGNSPWKLGSRKSDALLQRRMGRHQRGEMRDSFAEVEVAGLFRTRSDQPGAAVEAADLLQRSRQPSCVSGELNARRVGEQLAFPANRGFDEPGEEHADRADQV